jgi:hypothetical protein
MESITEGLGGRFAAAAEGDRGAMQVDLLAILIQ